MSRFDVTNYLAESEKLAQDVASTPIDKTTLLNNNKQNKLDRLSSYSVGSVRSVYDADTLTLNQDEVSTRLRGIDTFETPKSGDWFNNPNNIKRLDKQRQLLAAQSGVDPSTITNEDIFRRGTEQTGEARSVLGMGDSSLPAFVEYEQEYLTPLERQRNYGRNIGSVKPLAGPYSLPDDTEVLPTDITLGKGPVEIGTGIRASDFGEVDDDSIVGESVDIAQSSLIQQYGKTNKALRKGSRWLADKIGLEKATIDEWLPTTSETGTIGFDDMPSTDLAKREVTDKLTGVMAKSRKEQQQGMDSALKNVEKGEYLDAAWDTFKVLPYVLGDSTGEIASMFAGAPGIATAIAARVSEDAEVYKENNGKEADAEWVLKSTLANSVALFGERFLIKSGVVGALEKGTSKFKRLGAVGLSTTGETVQEWYDQIQQEYLTQKEGVKELTEIATSPEAQLAAITGGVMGGTLKGAGELTGATFDATKKLPVDKLKAEMARRREAKQTPEQKKADKIIEEEKATTKSGIEQFLDVSDELDAKGETVKATQAIIRAYSMLDDVKDDTERAKYEARADKRRESIKAKRTAEREAVIDRQDTKAIQVLGSSEDAVSKLKELLSTVDDLDSDKVNSALAKVSKELGINMDDISKIKTEVKAEKSALDVIKKSQIEVEGEVVSGPKGYETYYEGLKNAKLLDDKEGIEEFTGKLEYFKDSQTRKRDKLETGIKEVKASLMADIERDATARGISKGQALKDFLKRKFKPVVIEYSDTGKSFEVNPKNVLQNMLNSEIRAGAYSVVDAVTNSIEAMDS